MCNPSLICLRQSGSCGEGVRPLSEFWDVEGVYDGVQWPRLICRRLWTPYLFKVAHVILNSIIKFRECGGGFHSARLLSLLCYKFAHSSLGYAGLRHAPSPHRSADHNTTPSPRWTDEGFIIKFHLTDSILAKGRKIGFGIGLIQWPTKLLFWGWHATHSTSLAVLSKQWSILYSLEKLRSHQKKNQEFPEEDD